MDQTLKSAMEKAFNQLYQFLLYESNQSLQQTINGLLSQNGLTIVFERYLETNGKFFLYAYSFDSQIILQLNLYEHLIQDSIQYKYEVSEFLKALLWNNQDANIHFINFGEKTIECEEERLQIAQELVGLEYLKHVVFQMNGTAKYFTTQDILQIQISLKQLAIFTKSNEVSVQVFLNFVQNRMQNVQEVHQLFVEQLLKCEEQVINHHFYYLIKEVLIQKDLPYQPQYLATFLMNLPKLLCTELSEIMSQLRYYSRRRTVKIGSSQKKMIREIKNFIEEELVIFKQPKYQHFPMKQKNSQKCKVCQKLSSKAKKSNYRCEGCHEIYDINITLCTIKCFRKFHLNPEYYLRRSRRRIKKEEDT